MKWTDDAIILYSRKYNEKSLIVTALTQERGIYTSIVRSVKKSLPICQPGNHVYIHWNARNEEQMGYFSCELKSSFATLSIGDPLQLAIITSSCSLVKAILAQRDPNCDIFESLFALLNNLRCSDRNILLQQYVQFEVDLIKASGYGLDLSKCAASGVTDNLCYVSPKTGRAVSLKDGRPFATKLLKLPQFLLSKPYEKECQKRHQEMEIVDGITLTRYFLKKHLFSDNIYRKIPMQCEMLEQHFKKLLPV